MNLNGYLPVYWGPGRYRQFGKREPLSAPQPNNSFMGNLGALANVDQQINAIIGAFKSQSESAGMALAHQSGPDFVEGARQYVAARALPEESLAMRVAQLNAEFVQKKQQRIDVIRRFLDRRLLEVRAARARAATPPQAVIDRPEVPMHGIPRWITYAGFALSVTAFLVSLKKK
jgi:hypothetical protein